MKKQKKAFDHQNISTWDAILIIAVPFLFLFCPLFYFIRLQIH